MSKYGTVRSLVRHLLAICGDIDEPVKVKICRRDESNCVIHVSLVDINYIDSHGNICIEEPEIAGHWQEYHWCQPSTSGKQPNRTC